LRVGVLADQLRDIKQKTQQKRQYKFAYAAFEKKEEIGWF
jgi:hypothetical protein